MAQCAASPGSCQLSILIESFSSQIRHVAFRSHRTPMSALVMEIASLQTQVIDDQRVLLAKFAQPIEAPRRVMLHWLSSICSPRQRL